MQNKVIIPIILLTIAALLLLIVTLFLSSVIRRVYKERKYRRLDLLKKVFDKKIRESLESGTMMSTQGELLAPRNSDTWQAIEDVLLNMTNEERYRDEVLKLLSTLGYIAFYEKQLKNRNVQVRALSVDRLGRINSDASVPKLVALLDEKNPEIVSVTVRSLSRIGGQTALKAIVKRLPVILDRSIVTRKAMGMALQAFGADAIPLLVEQKAGRDNLWVMLCRLDILSRLPADPRSVRLATEHLSGTNVEVRSKALRVLGRAENIRTAHNLPELSYSIPDQGKYTKLFEERMDRLGFDAAHKERHHTYEKVYSTIMYTDDAMRYFFEQYTKLPAYGNTIFIITGDHRLPEIEMSTKIDRFHVPLIIFSPLLKRTAHIESISSQSDITPSLLAFLKKNYHIAVPSTVSWVGSGLDTDPSFRNIHKYPLKHTKTNLIDYVSGMYFIDQDTLFSIGKYMDLEPIQDEKKKNELIAEFNQYKSMNDRFTRELKLIPDSLYEQYRP